MTPGVFCVRPETAAGKVVQKMTALRVRRLFVVEYPGSEAAPAARAQLCSVAGASAPDLGVPSARAAFACTRLVPADLWLEGIRDWVALPLFYQREPLGFLLAELCLYDGRAYESLRVHVGAALWALRRAHGAG